MLLVIVQACADAVTPVVIVAGPCERIGACEVGGVDLVIDELTLAFPAAHPVDASGTRYVQEYDSVPVRYRVRNRGDRVSTAGSGRLFSCRDCVAYHARDVSLRALAPGEVDSGVIYVPPATSGHTQTVRPQLSLDIGGDLDEPFYRNNVRRTTEPYTVVVPTFGGGLNVTTPELRFGKPLRFTVTIRNTSAYAILRDTTVSFCFRQIDFHGPDSCNSPFNKLPVPRLAPGATWTSTVDLVVTHEMSGYPKHAAIRVRLDACLGARTAYVTAPCAVGTELTLLPDLESACTIAVIPFGVVQRGDLKEVCRYTRFYRIWSFEGIAGRIYSANAVLTPSKADLPVGIWDRDGNLQSHSGHGTTSATLARDGRYYLVVQSGTVSSVRGFEVVLREETP